jgi:predicted 2-oxoglutarate/Fe(II)-dependent dioxygenase YbiX
MSLAAGTPAPWFTAPSPVNPKFAFSSLGGRYIVMAFLPGPGPEREAALACIGDRREHFVDGSRVFFGVLPDRASYEHARNEQPFNWFGDLDGDLRRMFDANAEGQLDPQWVIVDPSLRILATAPLERGPALIDGLIRLGVPGNHAGVPLTAPVLIVPRVIEPSLCRQLIDLYHRQGGEPSGVMRDVGGRTVGVLDDFKRRRDTKIEDEDLKTQLRARLNKRLVPEIEKAFQFSVTYVERYIVARYDAEEGGYFRAHRDDTTAGTAHRKFAVSINLNSDFEGGDLRFPEYGPRTYRPPPGGAVVFSCTLLHEATPVTRGTRYAFLPFLYDEAGRRIREANLHLLDEGGKLVEEPDEPLAVRPERRGVRFASETGSDE